MRDDLNLFYRSQIRQVMRAARVHGLRSFEFPCKCIFIGESPPPLQRKLDRTSLARLAHLSGDPYLLSQPFVFRTNVNAANPGVRGRGSKAPNRREATITAYNALRLHLREGSIRVRDDVSVVFVLLGLSTAKAFGMYGEKSPNKFPPYRLYRLSRIHIEHQDFPWFVDRYVVRLPHPSNANWRGFDKDAVKSILSFIRANAQL